MAARDFLVVSGSNSLSAGALPNEETEELGKPVLPSIPYRQPSAFFNVTQQLRQLSLTTTTRTRPTEDMEYHVNPEPVPFQQQNFILPETKHLGPFKPPTEESSTSLKKVNIPRRHLDSFGGYEYSMGTKKGVILHTDRYQCRRRRRTNVKGLWNSVLTTASTKWDTPKILDGLSQRDRIRAELELLERLRGIRRKKELLPHRSQIDLLLGGKRMEFFERFDINREIQKLKSLVMPQHARDLFHGRGVHLPGHHMSLRPKKPPILDYDSDEDVSASAPASLQRTQPKPRRNLDGRLPQISTKASLLGLGSSHPMILAREKRTVDQIRARISIPSEKVYQGKQPVSIKTHDLFGKEYSGGRFSEDGPWTPMVSRQGTSPVYMKRSKTQITPKVEKSFQRSQTMLNKKTDKELKVTTTSEAVKRVDLHSASTSRSGARPHVVTVPGSRMEIEPQDSGMPEASDRAKDTEEKTMMETEDDLTGRTHRKSPVKSLTPNPLRGSDLPGLIPEQERSQLQATFKKLDTDDDGHLKYNQVQTQMPKLPTNQEKFLKEVYDITSSSTFFGVDEFMTMSALTKQITSLGTAAQNSFQSINFREIHDQIVLFVDLFQLADQGQRGKIPMDSMREILSQILGKNLDEDSRAWVTIANEINPVNGDDISKVEFLAHIPYFLSLRKS